MAISTRQVKNKRDSNGVLTGRPGTVYDVNIKYTAPDGKKKSYAKKGFATKKEAAQHEAEMKTKLQNPGQVASITSQRKQTVAAYLNDWVEKLLEDLDMPHIRFHDLRHTAATNMHQLTGDFYTVGEVLGHTLAGIGASLGLSMNFEAVTARYVDVRLERKKEVLDAYHSAVEKAAPEKPKEAEPKKGKRAAKKKHSEIDL